MWTALWLVAETVSIPASRTAQSLHGRGIVKSSTMATPLEIPDHAITRCTCTEEDFDVDLVKGQQYDVHRFGDGYTIPELHMTFSWHYFV